jgi:transketolase
LGSTYNHDTLEAKEFLLSNQHKYNKPMDEEAILKSLAKTKCIVTAAKSTTSLLVLAKAHQRVLALNVPTPQEFVVVNDSFGESGTPAR